MCLCQLLEAQMEKLCLVGDQLFTEHALHALNFSQLCIHLVSIVNIAVSKNKQNRRSHSLALSSSGKPGFAFDNSWFLQILDHHGGWGKGELQVYIFIVGQVDQCEEHHFHTMKPLYQGCKVLKKSSLIEFLLEIIRFGKLSDLFVICTTFI